MTLYAGSQAVTSGQTDIQTDRQTDRHNTANSHFSQLFC